jgi:hypothetical protein
VNNHGVGEDDVRAEDNTTHVVGGRLPAPELRALAGAIRGPLPDVTDKPA